MIDIKDKKKCSGCEACANVCPMNCITMLEDEEGHRYPKIDKDKCVKCNQCVKTCPIINKKEINNTNETIVYGAYNKDLKILKRSSSGGVFFELAYKIITEMNGVVFGVKYDKNDNAKFTYAETIEELMPILGSKYVQAKVNQSYKDAKNFLSKKRVVLFSGTPCQIAGLKSYLKKDYENLYTCDIICEGVPGDKYLNVFKEHYEKKYNSKIVNIKFRNKKYGWKYLGFLLEFENGREKYISRFECNYYNAFIKQIINRPSCYSCEFRELYSQSDFKVADFWEVNQSKKTKYNFYGVSHFIINSEKGKKLFNGLEKKLNLFESDIEEIKKLNNTFNMTDYEIDKRNEFVKQTKNKNNEDIFKMMDVYNDLNKKQQLLFRIKLPLVKLKYWLKK